jgi:DNA-binding beta-propeller fold protein YncE
LGGQQILTADLTTNQVTPVFNTVGTPDSLLFDASNNIVYTNLGTGQVRSYNPTTKIDSLLASGFNDPADLVLTPDKGSVLVSDFLGGTIAKVNLATHQVTQLGNYGGNPQGTAFDAAGHLFAVLGTRSGGATSFVAQLDPTTGAILNQSPNEVQLDGMTYDPFSGKIYSPSLAGNGIYQFDPTTLSAVLLPNSAGVGFDGITTDSAGNLYTAGGGAFIYQYNLISHTLTQRTAVPGLDDLAPLTGPGAATTVPEPASLTLLGIGALGLAGYGWRRLRQAA